MPTVRVLRPFANGHHEDIVHPGDEITVTEDRATDLGDLVERVGPKPARADTTEAVNKARQPPAAKPRLQPLRG